MLQGSIREKARGLDRMNLFDILGVPETATREEVKHAYLEAAKLYHPDRAAAVGLTDLAADAARIFRRLTEAHATLGDDARRAAYLEQLRGGVSSTVDGDALARRLLEAEASFFKGDALVKQGQFAAALVELQRAVEGNPDDGDHLALYAWARLGARQATPVEARAQIEGALRKAPRSARAHHYLGAVRLQLQDVDGAESCFRRALEIDPRFTESERELRVLAMRKKKK